MPYRYKALLLNCMDPRLQGENEIKIIGAAGFSSGEYEVLTYPGPSLWMTSPHQLSHSENFWWELENVSLKFHNIYTVVIVGHSQCGGFELKGAPSEPEKEKLTIINSLKIAGQAIKIKYPNLETKLIFVHISKDDNNNGLPEIFTEIIEIDTR